MMNKELWSFLFDIDQCDVLLFGNLELNLEWQKHIPAHLD